MLLFLHVRRHPESTPPNTLLPYTPRSRSAGKAQVTVPKLAPLPLPPAPPAPPKPPKPPKAPPPPAAPTAPQAMTPALPPAPPAVPGPPAPPAAPDEIGRAHV